MNASDWIKQHKVVVGLFGAAAAGAILFSYLRRGSSAGNASPIVGGNATGGIGSPQYLVPVVQSGAAPNPTATSPVSNVPVPSTPMPNPVPVRTPNHPVIAANPYTVGTRVTSNEVITQSLYDPLYGGWLNLTSKGGIYGGGDNVSASAFSDQWKGNGRLELIDGGARVQEYNAAGKLVGTFKVGK